MSIILYTTHCPKCQVLQKKLDQKEIPYSINENVDEMLKKGLMSAPGLEVDGTMMKFTEANTWINTH